ncbi:oligopeptide/dipeptide ABC transporter ATP-binding protein [Pseudofrankia inefficax]|uniref:Oligopeptide/dipeptide ABC transporter, ATPase subunit n=1 Tax=Pseudofrankia inefficax (strain DSM 45817 / CECT 9037 / DDB 130130 / EuI1c) TaxID=298654 RepID=E3J0K2_PSEI1|nr:ABC transporter ATP-binding protein [Pseudofrankia inefficax]ADP81631.1 oligopeptide/dipeptide ABC transporter, ATPase subunit [Pseudofrankia inefficax]
MAEPAVTQEAVTEVAGARTPAAETLTAGPVASVRGLTVSLTRNGVTSPVLRGVDLEIAPGEIVGLVGESGSGKSVLALALMGLLPAASRPVVDGEIRVAGTDVVHGSAAELRRLRRQNLGVIFQDPMTSLNPTMRVGRQITEVSRDEAEAVRLLTAVGVPEPGRRLRAFPHELSGGLRQRVMAAIALTGTPALVIADEPTTALDVTVQAQLLALLGELRDELGCAVLFITHDLAVAAQLTDRIAVLYQGRLAEVGPTGDVLHHAAHPYTAGLLGARLDLDTPRTGALRTLPPEAGDVAARLTGCAYHTRCPLVVERCATDQPPIERYRPHHLRACWRPAADVAPVVAAPPTPVHSAMLPIPTRPHAAAKAALAAEPTGEPVVEIRGLHCRFTAKSGRGPKHVVHALRGVDLDVRAGEALAVVGESGSGKSTLLRVIAGLTKPTDGTAVVHGGAQMVFQDAGSSLTPWLSVGSQLRERLRPLRLGKAQTAARITETLGLLGLPDAVLAARPAELSGGQRQRIGLARAVLVPPAVLLCDEPTSALDASLAATVLDLIRDLRARFGMAVVFVTHDLAVARLMGDRIAVIADGEVVETGATDIVLTAPAHERTRALLAAVPRLDHRPLDAVESA